MKKNVSQYISDLLYTHDCVIVPNFGGFVGNRKSAELNKKTGSLSPPSKQILFNRKLTTNDGLLFSYIAQKEVISQGHMPSIKFRAHLLLLIRKKHN